MNHTTPYWHACVKGPPPYGTMEPVAFCVDYIVQPSTDEAEEAVHQHLVDLCEMWGREFDADAWDISLRPVNCN
jgi:hypothetical protein